MDLSQSKAYTGLVTSATPVNSNIANDVRVGTPSTTHSLTSATKYVTFDALLVGASADLVLDMSDLDSTGTTAWTAGTAQVETATAAGTITGSGNASVVVTASGMTGSPKTISVAVVNGDTAATWAGKVRTALAADADVAALFTVGGTTTAISLTRLPTSTWTVNGSTVNVYPANDATLNISLDNGTCTGITTAGTSTDTTAGVATAGVYVPDLDGNDFEGNATGGATAFYGVYIEVDSTSDDSITLTQGSILADYPVPIGGVFQVVSASTTLNTGDITFEPASAGPCFVSCTIAAS